MKHLKFIPLVILCFALLFWPNTKAQTSNLTYYYVATAVDNNGVESVYSNQASCTFIVNEYTCSLKWNASTSVVSGYNLYRGNTTGGPYTKINTSLITVLTYKDVYIPPNPPTGLAGAISSS